MALPFGLKSGLTAKTNVKITDSDGTQSDDEYSARCLAHAVVYQKNGKAVKSVEVDDRIKEQLIGTMLAGAGAGVEAKLEEPIVPPIPEGHIVVDEASNVPDEVIADMARLEDEARKAAEAISIVTDSTPAAPNPFYEPSKFEDKPIEDDLGFDDTPAPEINYEELLAEVEARSVDNANLKVLVDALYRRFNVYLPYVNQPPRRSDISPITGAVMNALTYGQAVQGFKTAQRTGTSWNPAEIRSQLASSRSSSQDVDVMPRLPEEDIQTVESYGEPMVGMPSNLHGEPEQPEFPRELRRFASPHKSAQFSEHGKERDGLDPDEIYAEPPINAQSPIVRPYVINKRSQAKLEDINRQRMSTVPQNVGFDQLV